VRYQRGLAAAELHLLTRSAVIDSAAELADADRRNDDRKRPRYQRVEGLSKIMAMSCGERDLCPAALARFFFSSCG